MCFKLEAIPEMQSAVFIFINFIFFLSQLPSDSLKLGLAAQPPSR